MTQHPTQDSQRVETRDIIYGILESHLYARTDEGQPYIDGQEEAYEAIEAYVTTRVKEAEAEEVEMAADFAEDVLQQFGYNGKSGGLSTLEWAEGIIKRHKKLQALTTTTNGKEE